MARPVTRPPQTFQRTIAAWAGSSAGGAVGRGAPGSHRISFRTQSVEFGAVVLNVNLDEAWRAGVREVGAGPLGAMLDAAFEAAAQTVSGDPLVLVSLEVRAPTVFRLRTGWVTAQARIVGRHGPDLALEGEVRAEGNRVLAFGAATYGPAPAPSAVSKAGARPGASGPDV